MKEKEIERKFFIKEMPDLSHSPTKHYERYILQKENGVEVRITKVNDTYIYERKTDASNLSRENEVKNITKEEFDSLKSRSIGSIIRDGYEIGINPRISIKIYREKFEGLIRAEVEFENEQEANTFIPLPWMGKEMTGLPIAKDSELVKLSEEEFKTFLKFIEE